MFSRLGAVSITNKKIVNRLPYREKDVRRMVDLTFQVLNYSRYKMIIFPLKQAALAAALAGMSVGAYAQQDLGTVDFSSPTVFNSIVAPTTNGFTDTFLFSVQEPN